MRRGEAAALLGPLLLSVLVGSSSEALSTFGVSNTRAPTLQPTPPPARPCQRQTDCAGIVASSCVRTHYDAVTRCLCGDNLPPVNGQCEAQTKALYHACGNSDECNDGLVCATPNVTASGSGAGAHYRVHAPTDKICLCDADSGFVLKEHLCNDAHIVTTSVLAAAVATLLRTLLAD